MGICKSIEDGSSHDGISQDVTPPVIEVTGLFGAGDVLLGEYILLGSHDSRPYYQKRQISVSTSPTSNPPQQSRQPVQPVFLFHRGDCWIFSDKLWSKQGGAYARSEARLPLSTFVETPWIVRYHQEWQVVTFKIKEYFPPLLHITSLLEEEIEGQFDILGEYRDRPFYRRKAEQPEQTGENSEQTGENSDQPETLYLYYQSDYKSWMIGPKLWSKNCAMFLETASLSPLNSNSSTAPTVLTAKGWVKDHDLNICEFAWWEALEKEDEDEDEGENQRRRQLEEEDKYTFGEEETDEESLYDQSCDCQYLRRERSDLTFDDSVGSTVSFSTAYTEDDQNSKLWRHLVIQAAPPTFPVNLDKQIDENEERKVGGNSAVIYAYRKERIEEIGETRIHQQLEACGV